MVDDRVWAEFQSLPRRGVRQLLGHLSEIVYSKQQEEHSCTMEGTKMRRLCVHLSLGKEKALFIVGSQILRNATRTVSQNTMAAQL